MSPYQIASIVILVLAAGSVCVTIWRTRAAMHVPGPDVRIDGVVQTELVSRLIDVEVRDADGELHIQLRARNPKTAETTAVKAAAEMVGRKLGIAFGLDGEFFEATIHGIRPELATDGAAIEVFEARGPSVPATNRKPRARIVPDEFDGIRKDFDPEQARLASAELEGRPGLAAGDRLEFKKVGRGFTGEWIADAVRHRFDRKSRFRTVIAATPHAAKS
jgi:hypothetical protein